MTLKTGVLLCAVLFLSGCYSTVSTPTTSGSVSVDVITSTPAESSEIGETTESTEAIETVEATASDELFVIDVRSLPEWNSGHLEQATHIPHTEIGDRIGEVTTQKDAKIIVYCRVGGRAGLAKSTLEGLGYTNVENGGGYDDVVQRFQQQ